MIYIRRVGELVDGAVTEAKLATNAVTEAKINNGAVTENKLGNGSVVEAKLANLSVATEKLKDQAVSLAKAQQALKIHHFVGDETEDSVEGVTEIASKIFKFPKASTQEKGIQPTKLHINAELKTSDTAYQGTLKVYLDAEETARITITTTSETYEMVEGEADISDLTNGKHTVTTKLYSADASGIMYNDLTEIFLEI